MPTLLLIKVGALRKVLFRMNLKISGRFAHRLTNFAAPFILSVKLGYMDVDDNEVDEALDVVRAMKGQIITSARIFNRIRIDLYR